MLLIDVILACDKLGGIGLDGKLPWHIPAELKLFKRLTKNSVLVVGRTTFDSLPPLPGRVIYVVTSRQCHAPNVHVVDSFGAAYIDANVRYNEKKIFVAGGGQLYDTVFEEHARLIQNIHVSVVHGEYECDTWIDSWQIEDVLEEQDMANKECVNYDEFRYIRYSTAPNPEIESLRVVFLPEKMFE